MTLVVPEVSQVTMLTRILGQAGIILKLFSNNLTPTKDTVLTDIVQVSGGGYAAVTLTYTNWAYTQDVPSYALYNAFINFTFTGPNTTGKVYGYYLVDASNNLLFLENIGLVSPVNGTVIPIKPKLTAQSLNQ